MHGLVNKSIQCFVKDTYGCPTWREVARHARSPVVRFEAMLVYDDALTEALVNAACAVLGKRRCVFLEDLGTYLVCDPNRASVRRLLRFGGDGYDDFLHSLDDLPDLVRLALPDLWLPSLRLETHRDDTHRIEVGVGIAGFCWVLKGALGAMADEYGVLVVLHCEEDATGSGRITMETIDYDFALARSFHLGGVGA